MTTDIIAATPCGRITMTAASTTGERAVKFERGVVEYSERDNSSAAASAQVLETGVSFLSFPLQDLSTCSLEDYEESGDVINPDLYEFEPRGELTTAAASGFNCETSNDRAVDDSFRSFLVNELFQDDAIDPFDEFGNESGLDGPDSTLPEIPMPDTVLTFVEVDGMLTPICHFESVEEEAFNTSGPIEITDDEYEDSDSEAPTSEVDDSVKPDPVLTFVEEDGPLAPIRRIKAVDSQAIGASVTVETTDDDNEAFAELCTTNGIDMDKPFREICWELDVQRLAKAFYSGRLLDEHDVFLYIYALEIKNARRRYHLRPLRRPRHPADPPGKPLEFLETIREKEEDDELEFDCDQFLKGQMRANRAFEDFVSSMLQGSKIDESLSKRSSLWDDNMLAIPDDDLLPISIPIATG